MAIRRRGSDHLLHWEHRRTRPTHTCGMHGNSQAGDAAPQHSHLVRRSTLRPCTASLNRVGNHHCVSWGARQQPDDDDAGNFHASLPRHTPGHGKLTSMRSAKASSSPALAICAQQVAAPMECRNHRPRLPPASTDTPNPPLTNPNPAFVQTTDTSDTTTSKATQTYLLLENPGAGTETVKRQDPEFATHGAARRCQTPRVQKVDLSNL